MAETFSRSPSLSKAEPSVDEFDSRSDDDDNRCGRIPHWKPWDDHEDEDDDWSDDAASALFENNIPSHDKVPDIPAKSESESKTTQAYGDALVLKETTVEGGYSYQEPEPEAGGATTTCMEHCDECSKEHPRYSYCPYLPCDICYKEHGRFICPYLYRIPKGAAYSPYYQIVCVCGNVFNEDEWVCTSCCAKDAMLIHKHCGICNSNLHAAYECPKDKVAAASYKLARDKRRSVVPVLIQYAPGFFTVSNPLTRFDLASKSL